MAKSAGIVGGGISGLIAAIELARAGVETVVFEAAAEPGGRARTRQTGGFSLNQGPHALYRKGAFRQTLIRLGVAIPGAAPMLGGAYGLYEGQVVGLPASLASLATTRMFGVRDKVQFGATLKAVMDGASAEGSLSGWFDAIHLRPRVRAAMEALARLVSYANAPEKMSAAAALEQIRLGLAGVIYIDGGWASLVEGLRQAAVAAGAVVRTGAAVERVEVDGDTTRIVLADGEEDESDAVLLAVGPQEAARLAPGASSLKAAAADAVAIRANSLDLGLERLPEGARTFMQGIDGPFYFSVHSMAGRLAPDGGAMVHVSRYLRSGEAPKADAIEELEAYADIAMPGWRALENTRQTLLGMVVSNAVVRWDRPRPGVGVEGAPGLFIAGDWVGATGMLSDASAASAVEAARAMLDGMGVSVPRAA
ncbi:MAG TPA: FAD-dependent oxidoreductase [Hyphomonadaceae bacterium]|nr:FAD-dependent oxidoreductase [Hyphomonadaceae bacterium]